VRLAELPSHLEAEVNYLKLQAEKWLCRKTGVATRNASLPLSIQWLPKLMKARQVALLSHLERYLI
jgi:hypothetical protein